MRKLICLSVIACMSGLLAVMSFGADAAPATITGVVIDQACGAKMVTKDDPEKAAEAHPKSCAMKEDCAKSGYGVISGKEMIKFDDNGNKLAKDFIEKSTKTDGLRAKVTGTRDGDHMAVTAITAE